MTTTYSATPQANELTAPQLRGDIAIWMIILAELLAFSIFFIAYMWLRLETPEAFNDKQAQLNLGSGLFNTICLISASYGVAKACSLFRSDKSQQARYWWWFAIACGLGFIANKTWEFFLAAEQGVFTSEHPFDLFYLWLGGFHYLHVVLGVIVLFIAQLQFARLITQNNAAHVADTCGAYWHMVDLVWLILFPMLYVLR